MNKEALTKKYNSPAYWTQLIQLSLYDMIKSYLNSEGITQKEFASRIGVSKGYVTQILNGDFDHRLSKMVQLGIACGMVPKFEFVPMEHSEQTLRDTYLKPTDWHLSGQYTDTIKLERHNPFTPVSIPTNSYIYKGSEEEWEENDNDTKIA